MPNDKDWIATVTGGLVTRFDKTTAGRSRGTWLVDVKMPDVKMPAGSLMELVLRRDTGDGPLSGTELSLERESHVYRALLGTAVPVPSLLAVSADGDALLVERIAGTEDLNGLKGEGTARVAESFVDAVVALHSLDTESLDLPGFHRPADAAAHALGDVELWSRILDEHVAHPLPILKLVIQWLRANPPEGPPRTVLCHGDCGPGNFMHDQGEVTGLLDWEFAHLGDPMDDLAWIALRMSQLGGLGEIDDVMDLYHERSGTAIDSVRVRYYQLLVLVRMAISCSVALEGKSSGGMDTSTYFMLIPLLQSQMARLLGELAGFELSQPETIEPGPATLSGPVIDALSTDLGSVLGPELQSESARSRMMGMMILLSHLGAADTLGPKISAVEVEELRAVIGDDSVSLADGDAKLVAAIDAGTVEFEQTLDYLWRRGNRQVQLWPIIAEMASRTLPVVASRP